MTKVRYVVIPQRTGHYHDKIECAVRTDGSSPAKEFLLSLRKAAWPNDEPVPADPEATPVHVFSRLLAVMEFLAKFGEPEHAHVINFLVDGIWEFKGDIGRMPYFDVDPANGHHLPKDKIWDRRTVDPENKDDRFWYPLMDRTLRLTHGFLKDSDGTRPTDIDLAKTIRTEDLEHE